MAKALYYNEALEPKEFEILATNGDKTIDIGTVDAAGKKTVVVQKVVVGDAPKIGGATVDAVAEKKPSDKPPGK